MRRTSGSVLAMDDPVTAWSRTDRPGLSPGQAAEILRIGAAEHGQRATTDAPDVEHQTSAGLTPEVAAPLTLTDLAAVVGRGGASITLLLCAAGLLASGAPESGQLAPHGATTGGSIPGGLRPAARAEPGDPGAGLETSETRSMQKQIMGVAALGAALAIGDVSHAQAVQWRVEDGGNGHWYQLESEPLDWPVAQQRATSMGGHLVTLTSQAESNFVRQALSLQTSYFWIGGRQAIGACEPACGWGWVTGEPWDYTNWNPGEPNNAGGNENWLECYPNGGWNDRYPGTMKSVCEWSADCNGDGIVDYGQILQGQLPDANGNGIPDPCESIIRVPADIATIQAAIDSVPATATRTVLVAPGTYSGPIDFRGKNVVVRGAGAATTIIQGTGGIQSAVVRFSGGEPPSAALEQFTIRGGLTGSPIPQAPQFLVGGGLFANESAAKVRDCVLEDNFASYGGGAYLRNSTTSFERCTFRLNRSGSFGGGLQFLNSNASMIDCVLQQNRCESRGGGIHIVNGTTGLTRVTVTANTSATVMGGISFDHAIDPSASLQLVDCTVTGNTALLTQGGVGVLAASGPARLSLTGTTVCTNYPRPNIAGVWQDLGGNTVCACPADLTGNDAVNGDDLGILLAAWGPCTGGECVADINRDGAADGIDLGQLLAAWGPCPN